MHSSTRCRLRSGHTKKQSISLVAVIHKQKSRHMMPKSVSRAVLGGMQFTLHATRRTPHGTSRLVQEISASGWCKPDVLRPGIVGMQGFMGIRLRPCTNLVPHRHAIYRPTGNRHSLRREQGHEQPKWRGRGYEHIKQDEGVA